MLHIRKLESSTLPARYRTLANSISSRPHTVEAVQITCRDANARECALLLVRPGPAAMERRPLIPNQHVAHPPRVRIHSAGAGGEGDQFVDGPGEEIRKTGRRYANSVNLMTRHQTGAAPSSLLDDVTACHSLDCR